MSCCHELVHCQLQDDLSTAHGLTRSEDHGNKNSPTGCGVGHSSLTSDQKLASNFLELASLTLLDSRENLVFCFTAYLRSFNLILNFDFYS